MSRLARLAERIKLARVLGVPESALDTLGDLDAASLRAFREQASARLFDADEARLKRVAAASKLLPVPLIALIAEHVFGALLCARVSGLLAPDRAAEVALRLRTGFLADLTLEIDPRHVREVIQRIPIPRLVDVALELARRGEFVTLARFIDFVSLDAIRAVMDKLTDNAALLHIAFFVENPARLSELVGFLPESRLRAIITVAADETRDLWPEALALMNEVTPHWRKTLGELAATMDDAIVISMARSAQAQNLWGAVLPIIGVMDAVHQRRLLALPVLRDDAMLDGILAAVESEDLWEKLIPLVPMMGAEEQQRLARRPRLRLPGVFEAALAATGAHGLWNALLPLVPLMDEATQERLAQAAGALKDADFGTIFDSVQASAQWSPLLALLLRLPAQTHARLAPLVRRLSPETARHIAQEAERQGLLGGFEALWASLARIP